MRRHLTDDCEKIKDKNIVIIELSLPDFFEGIEERVKLMTKEAQEAL